MTTAPNSVSDANTGRATKADGSTEPVDNISADGNCNRRNQMSRQEWSNPRVFGQGAYRTTKEQANEHTTDAQAIYI